MSKSVCKIIREYRNIGNTDDPEFSKSRKVYDWRIHVPNEIAEIWKDLTVEARVMVYLTATKYANDLERHYNIER